MVMSLCCAGCECAVPQAPTPQLLPQPPTQLVTLAGFMSFDVRFELESLMSQVFE